MTAITKTLMAMAGQDDVVVVHRHFFKFTGSLESAMMLGQLLYWTPRAVLPDGWIAKSDKEWQEELCLTRYSHRKATEDLRKLGVIETKIQKFKGAPTLHYRVMLEKLENLWSDYLNSDNGLSGFEQSESPKTDEPSSGIERTYTKTTPKTTHKTKAESGAPAPLPSEEPKSLYYEDITDEDRTVKIAPKVPRKQLQPLMGAIGSVIGMDMKISSNWNKVAKLAKSLHNAGYTAIDVEKIFGLGGVWYREDWRGRKGEHPDMKSISERIGVLSGRVAKPKGGGSRIDPAAEVERIKRLTE